MMICRRWTTMNTAAVNETTHKKYGEAMGILAGDALLNYAYETAIQAF